MLTQYSPVADLFDFCYCLTHPLSVFFANWNQYIPDWWIVRDFVLLLLFWYARALIISEFWILLWQQRSPVNIYFLALVIIIISQGSTHLVNNNIAQRVISWINHQTNKIIRDYCSVTCLFFSLSFNVFTISSFLFEIIARVLFVILNVRSDNVIRLIW